MEIIFLPVLLIMAGDVELNPGPQGGQIETMDDIIKHYKLKKDFLSTELIQEYMLTISLDLDNWKSFGRAAGLTEADLVAIQRDEFDETDRRHRVLVKWHQINPHKATYKELITILLTIRRIDIASKVCTLQDDLCPEIKGLNESVVAECTPTVQEALMDEDVEKIPGVGQSRKRKRKTSLPVTSKRTFPNLCVSKLSEAEIKAMLPRLYLESTNLCCQFNTLCTELCQSLTDRKVPTKKLLVCVLGLKTFPPVYKSSHLPILKDQKPNLLAAEDIEDVWIILDDYFSYFNYYIVKIIANKLGTEYDKLQMSSYEQDFMEYVKHRVYECPAEFGPINDEDCTIIVKLDKHYDNCTAEQLIILTEKLCEILKILSDGVLRLCHVEQGCYELTYQAPAFIQDIVFPLSSEQETALKNLQVVWLLCGDYEYSQEDDASDDHNSGDKKDDDDYPDSGSQATYEKYLLEKAMGGIQSPKKSPDSASDSGIGGKSAVDAETSSFMTEFTEDIFVCDIQVTNHETVSQDVQKVSLDLLPSVLNIAAFNGNLLNVKYCVEVLCCNPLLINNHGNTTLHVATNGEQLEIIKYLVEKLKCLPVVSPNEKTPLHIAAWNGCLPLVEYFVGKVGMDPLLLDNQQKTPLHYACGNGSIDVVTYLLEQAKHHDLINAILEDRTKLGNSVLHLAAASGNCNLVQHFISAYGLDPNIPGQLRATPLLVAAQEGHLDVIKYLVSLKSCTISCTLQEKKQNAVHIAAKKGHLAIVKFFKKNLSFNINVSDTDGYTPLHLASQNGYIDIVEYLAEQCQCDVLSLTKKRQTPLHLAAEKGHLNVVSYFTVQQNIDPLCKYLNTVTPLHLAVKGRKLEVVAFYVEQLNVQLVTFDRLGEKLFTKSVDLGITSMVKLFASKLQWCTESRGFRQTHLILKAITQGNLEILKYFLIERCWVPFLSRKQGSLLHIAAAIGFLNIVKFLIKELNYDPNATDYDKLTPLRKACQGGHDEIVKFLVFEVMVDVNAAAIHGLAPLHIAAAGDNCKVAEHLLQCDNVNPKCADKFGRTPIHYSAMAGKLELLKCFISRNQHSMYWKDTLFGKNALHLAVFHGHLSIAKYLVSEMGMDPNVRQAEYPRTTPIQMACERGHKDIVDYLLSVNNCLKNTCDSDGGGPLHYALQAPEETIKFIEFLVREKKYDPMCKDFEGNTLLHEAVQGRNLDLVKYFTNTLNINPSLPNFNGMTPLHFATRKGRLNIVKFLTLEKKCNPLCRENYDNVPMFYAVRYKHFAVLKFFLYKLKVHPLILGDLRRSVFHEAARNGDVKVWKLLVSVANKRHVSYNTKDENQVTPLHVACREGHITIARQILQDNPCSELPLDDHNQTPLHYAVRKDKLDIVKFLCQEKNFDSMTTDVNDNTPLHFAARRDHLEIVEFYESCLNCNMFVQNVYGDTPAALLAGIPVEETPTLGQSILHLAAEIGKVSFMKVMLRKNRKFDPNSKDRLCRTPLHYAAMRGKFKAVELLLGAKATPLAEDVFHNLPLHYATALGHLDIVKLLIQNGSPYNTRGVLGLTPLQMAEAGTAEYDGIYEFLQKKLFLVRI